MIARSETIRQAIDRTQAHLDLLKAYEEPRQWLITLEERVLANLQEVYIENVGRR